MIPRRSMTSVSFTFHFSLSLFTYSQNVFSPFLSDAFLLRRITEDTDAVGASISLTLYMAVSSGLLIVVVTFVFTGLLVNKHTIKCQLWARSSPKSWINLFFTRISNEFIRDSESCLSLKFQLKGLVLQLQLLRNR